eukprot:TRINITY_DN8790_c0_g1_i1.p1 TRINITY_DN8790_c0_g1~~TRINITY_DN8790_c0_g1_i1.p1  ORF type:complete len:161 (+),score=58.73 TRINITY_DN8790_c0_g1_i1:50-532(+)
MATETQNKNEFENKMGDKVNYYQKLILEYYEPKLQFYLEQTNLLKQELEQFNELREKIFLIQENNLVKLKTQVEIGPNYYVQAIIEDTTKIFVNVGLGFHVEFTLPEALKFIDKKTQLISNKMNKIHAQTMDIQATIKLIYFAIEEALKLPEKKKSQIIF